MRGLTRALILGAVVGLTFSCGGGGGGGSVSGETALPETSAAAGSASTPSVSSEPAYKTVEGTINSSDLTARRGTTAQPVFVCAVYKDTTQAAVPVPVSVDCAEIVNNTFKLRIPENLENQKFALFFYGANGLAEPLGYAGSGGKVYLLDFSGEGTVKIDVTLSQDSSGALEGDVAEQSLIADDSDTFFNGDEDSDGIKNPEDPDYLTATYCDVAFLDVGRARKEAGLLEDNLDNDLSKEGKSYYYFETLNNAWLDYYDIYNKDYAPAEYQEINGAQILGEYYYVTDANGETDLKHYYSVPPDRMTALIMKAPVWVAPIDNRGNLLPWDELQKVIENTKYGIDQWNSVFKEYVGHVGFYFMGVEPPIKGEINPALGALFEKTSYYLPTRLTGVAVEVTRDFPEQTAGRSESGSLTDDFYYPVTYQVQTTNGTQTSKYWWYFGIGRNLIWINANYEGYKKVVAHELGHVLGFDHPFNYGLSDIPSIMNYDETLNGSNGTDQLSDFDKKLFKETYGMVKDYPQYVVTKPEDFQTCGQKWFDDFAPVEVVQIQ